MEISSERAKYQADVLLLGLRPSLSCAVPDPQSSLWEEEREQRGAWLGVNAEGGEVQSAGHVTRMMGC